MDHAHFRKGNCLTLTDQFLPILYILCMVSFFLPFAPVYAHDEKQNTSWITLGTNAGPIPNSLRMQPSNLLVSGDTEILVDAGDGAAHQLSKVNVSLVHLDAVVISHLHFDHIGGLFALLGQRYQLRIPKVLTIYGPAGTRAILEAIIVGIDRSPDAGLRAEGSAANAIKIIEISDGSIFKIDDVAVKAVANSHFSASPHLDGGTSLSYRFDVPDRSITYTGDTGPSEALVSLARGSDLLVSEIFLTEKAIAVFRKNNPGASEKAVEGLRTHFVAEHLSPKQVGALAKQAQVEELVLTHNFVAPMESVAMRDDIVAEYAGKIAFAQDLDAF